MHNPTIEVETVAERCESKRAKRALARVDVVLGCVDRDGVRFQLNEFCCRWRAVGLRP